MKWITVIAHPLRTAFRAPSFSEAEISFLNNCRLNNRSERTLDNYRSDLRRFAEFLGRKKVHFFDCGVELITEYQTELARGNMELIIAKKPLKKLTFLGRFFRTKVVEEIRPYPPLAVASRRRHLSTLKNFFDFFHQRFGDKWSVFQNNPVRSKLHGIKLKDVDQVPTRLLTDSDWLALQRVIVRLQDQLMLQLLYFGGFRLAELTQLKASHFEKDLKRIVFPRKGGSVHKLKIERPSLIFESLEKHMVSQKSEFLFGNKLGTAPVSSKTLYNRIQRLILKAKCPTEGLGPHSFRKACATRLYKKTKDLLFVRNYLNHSDAKVTQTYIEI